ELATRCANGLSVILKGPPGVGKTFTLIQLALGLSTDAAAPVPIMLSLADWASSKLDLFDYVVHRLTFHGLSPESVRELNRAGRLMLILNGWNEVPEDLTGWATTRLKGFNTSGISPPVVVST